MSPPGHLQQLQRLILSMYLPMQVLSQSWKSSLFSPQKTKYIEILPELTVSWVFFSSEQDANSDSNGPWDFMYYLGSHWALRKREWNSQEQGRVSQSSGGLAKTGITGAHSHSFWFSICEVGPRTCLSDKFLDGGNALLFSVSTMKAETFTSL